MYCMLLSNWNKLCKRFHLNPTNPVAQRRQKKINNSGLWRWTRWRDLGWEVWERTNNFCCQGLD